MTEASRAARARPLSPHLQIWRWHITMACSILHRASIFALYFAALLLVWWILSLAAGPEVYYIYTGLVSSPLGVLVLIGLTFMLFYNLAYNVRQTFWDLGYGFLPRIANATGLAAIAFGAVATALVWIGVFAMGIL